MRELSEIEKKIIITLLNNGNTLGKLLGNIGKELIIQVNNKEQKVTILKKRILENETLSSNDDLKNFWIERLFFISTLINLLNYLETAGYIISHLLSNENDDEYYIGDDELVNELTKQSIRKVLYELDDKQLISLIIRFCYRVILPTESLKVFVKNRFNTPEQIRFKKNFSIAVIAIIISFLLGLSSLCISIMSVNKSTSLNTIQMNALTNRLDSIYNQIKLNNKDHIMHDFTPDLDSLIYKIYLNLNPK